MSASAELSFPVHILSQSVRLTRKHINTLFGEDYALTPIHQTSWSGEPIHAETVTLQTEHDAIEGLRVIGAGSKSTTVNLVKSHFKALYPRKEFTAQSSETSFGGTIQGPQGTVVLADGVRELQRHCLLPERLSKELSLGNEQTVSIHLRGSVDRTLHHIPVLFHSEEVSCVFLDPEETSSTTISELTRAVIDR